LTHEERSRQQIRGRALKLLSRREHTELELRNKLSRGGAATDSVLAVIAALKQENLQSDERFAEVYVRSRMERGDGPLKIRSELAGKGVSDELIERFADPADGKWAAVLRGVWTRRFGSAPADYAEWARQARFLRSRGFTVEQINKVVSYKD
jgi:regulatory protein